jgi:hypothetical protein
MPSTFTTNLAIEKPATGEQSGSWGDTTNFNFDIFDRLTGYKSVTLSSTSSTLDVRPSSPSSGASNVEDGMFRAIKFVDGGDLGGTVTLTVGPNTSSVFFLFQNALSGSRDITVTQGSGSNVTVVNGQTAIIYCDGAGSGAAVVSISDNLSMSNAKITGGSVSGITDLAVADGGTGASTASAALTNLGAEPAGTAVALAIALG